MLEGCFENQAAFGLKTELSVAEAGQVIATPTGVEHEIKCLSEIGKTLHVYVPKIQATSGENRFFSETLSQLNAKIDLSLSEAPTRWRDVEQILNRIADLSVSTHSPYFMNQLFSGVFPETLAASKIVAQARTTMATFEASPVFTAIELEVIDNLCALVGWPVKQRDGIAVPGGSAANFMAIHCARQQRAPEFRKRGHQGEKFKIFCSREAHYSLKKACLVTGLGTDALVLVDADGDGRMIVADLTTKIQLSHAEGEIPLLICATSGTTVFGAFDPLNEIADICRTHGIWLHVDGAWGGPALFSNEAKHLMRGIDRADSLTFDAHKLFGANLTSSFFLTKHAGVLLAANDVAGGDYLFHSEEVVLDRGRLSWQCGRGPDAMSFWTQWKNHGTRGLGEFVDRLFAVRDESVRWIKAERRLELVNHPAYLNICVRILPPHDAPDPDWSKKVRERLKQINFAFVNFSQDERGSFLRLILAHPKLEFSHIQTILSKALEVK